MWIKRKITSLWPWLEEVLYLYDRSRAPPNLNLVWGDFSPGFSTTTIRDMNLRRTIAKVDAKADAKQQWTHTLQTTTKYMTQIAPRINSFYNLPEPNPASPRLPGIQDRLHSPVEQYCNFIMAIINKSLQIWFLVSHQHFQKWSWPEREASDQFRRGFVFRPFRKNETGAIFMGWMWFYWETVVNPFYFTFV